MMAHQPLLDALTERELDIARLIVDGLTNHEIAQKLVLTHGTVKWYCGQIYSKLGVNTRSQAIKRIQALHILDNSDVSGIRVEPRLPTQLTTFIGREREIAEIRQLLQTNRLLTLTGPGGTGKTRLALAVAANTIAEFGDGVSFVDLALVADEEQVAKAIATTLGVKENVNEDVLETLKRALSEQEHLLLIDNFEHVIRAAPVVSKLLMAAPHLKVLVTSREALRLSGEQEYAVPPLTLPSVERDSVENVRQSEAVTLFQQRAALQRPDFDLTDDNLRAVAGICVRLDGLPLAIELAAARCKLLSPQAMLARLESRLITLTGGSRDAPARQQTLRNTIEWSYNLLDEGEKKLFARLGVFRGGRSLEAIEVICGDGLPIDILNGLAALVDKSLIQQKEAPGGEPRFVMLETIHEYARERLAASNEAETIRRRYAMYFVELAERAELELRLAEHYRWSQTLEQEMNNLRAVLEWSLGDGDPAFGVRLAGALALFWWVYGYHVEGHDWTQQLIKRLEEVSAAYHAKFLFSTGTMAIRHYDFEMAKRLFTRALEISRELGDKRQTGWALAFLGNAMLGETEDGLAAAEEGLALFRELDYKPGIAAALNSIGEYARVGGDDDRAKRAYEECLAVCQETGETPRIQLIFLNLAFLAQHKGDHPRAIDLARQGLQLAHKMNNRLDIGGSLTILAGSLGMTGQPERAARMIGAWEAGLESMGAFHLATDKPELERLIAAVRAQLDEATFEAAWAEGAKMTLEQAVADALGEYGS